MATAEYMRRYYQDRIARGIAMLGGVCAGCGSADDLQFDHVDPATKTACVTSMWQNWAAFVEELAKCQLLCGPCHEAKTLSEAGKTSAKGTHGTISAYRHCGPPKCADCRAAKNEVHRAWKARTRT